MADEKQHPQISYRLFAASRAEMRINMKKERNELLEFFGGLAMLAVGLYLFMNKVDVSTSFLGSEGLLGVHWLPSGLVVVPFIIGVFLMFVMPDNLLGKIIAGLGALLVVASVITSTTIRLRTVTLYEWILFLVLIFAGLGLVLRVLFAKPKTPRDKDEK